jgi:hypothetical protein
VSKDTATSNSPAAAVLATIVAMALVIGVLAWPWPRLCFDDPSFYNCNPMLWIKRAMDRILGN